MSRASIVVHQVGQSCVVVEVHPGLHVAPGGQLANAVTVAPRAAAVLRTCAYRSSGSRTVVLVRQTI